MPHSFLIVVTLIIIVILSILGLIYHWSSTEIDRVDSLDCNELWEEIIEHEKEFRELKDLVFATWITKECWS